MAPGLILIGLSVVATALITIFTNLAELRDVLGGGVLLVLLLAIVWVSAILYQQKYPAWFSMAGVSSFPGMIAGFRGGTTAMWVMVVVFCVFGLGVGLILDEHLRNRTPECMATITFPV